MPTTATPPRKRLTPEEAKRLLDEGTARMKEDLTPARIRARLAELKREGKVDEYGESRNATGDNSLT